MPAARPRPVELAAVASGGALGATLRWLLAEGLEPAGALPATTLAANLAGALGLGLAVGPGREALRRRPVAARFVTTGLLGAFTTWSALAVESAVLARDGDGLLAAAYVAGTAVAALALAAAASRRTPRTSR